MKKLTGLLGAEADRLVVGVIVGRAGIRGNTDSGKNGRSRIDRYWDILDAFHG